MNNCDKEVKIVLSFIVPIYNVEEYVAECLESLILQNCSHDEYEIVCVNDGSTDASVEIVKKYITEYNNISLINKANGGVSSARNVGLEAAKGKYIWFIDGDDYIKHNCLGEIIALIKRYSPELITIGHKSAYREEVFAKEDLELIWDWEKDFKLGGFIWESIIKSDIIKEEGIRFDETMKYSEDILFSFNVGLHRSKIGIIIKNELYIWRQRQGSATHSQKDEDFCKHIYDSIKLIKAYNQACNDTKDKQKKKFIRRLQYLETETVLRLTIKSSLNPKEVLQNLKDEGLYPYPLQWKKILKVRGLKGKIAHFCFMFLKFEWIYLLVCKTHKKTKKR